MPPRRTAPRTGDVASKAKPGRRLVIVESRAKAATLQKFLGNGYQVTASIGHVRDLPESTLGINKAKDFEPTYVVPPAKRKLMIEIGAAGERAQEVLIATDPDREGEAIAWHLLYAAHLEPAKVHRVSFHEITESAVRAALDKPGAINMQLVEAQQARRILDRLVGFEISPILSRRIHGAKSAGRVQSVALRFVVDREREIRQFVPQEWWSIEAKFSRAATEQSVFPSVLEALKGELQISSESEANAIVALFEGAEFHVAEIAERTTAQRPQAPFTTASLQRAASSELGISPSAAMAIAQRLYEGIDVGEAAPVGLITYMRTDSTQVAAVAQQEAREFVAARFGSQYVPERPPVYKTKTRNAQEAHEAIRPTSAFRTPERLAKFLDGRQLRLYGLIWRRFVASQMAAASVRSVAALIHASAGGEAAAYRFRSATSEVLFPGHFAVSRAEDKIDQVEAAARTLVLALKKGDAVILREIRGFQHFTEPPPRYSEAGLIRVLEEEGIGRPSTYAPTIQTLIERAYVEVSGRVLSPTELGESVTDAMVEHFPDIVDKDFTRRMEEELDEIATGDLGRIDLLKQFYAAFGVALKQAGQNMKTVKPAAEPLGQACPVCGRELLIKRGRFGKFVSCSGYPDCEYKRPLGIGVACPKCGVGEIVERKGRKGRGRRFYGCSRYPECDFTSQKRPLAEKCPECGGTMYAAARGGSACGACRHKQPAA